MQIYAWMDELASRHSGVVSVAVAGETYEGRELRVLRVALADNLPVVVVEAGAHAREWITNAVATYLANEILGDKETPFRHLARQFEWHIFPSVNPDGYVHSLLQVGCVPVVPGSRRTFIVFVQDCTPY